MPFQTTKGFTHTVDRPKFDPSIFEKEKENMNRDTKKIAILQAAKVVGSAIYAGAVPTGASPAQAKLIQDLLKAYEPGQHLIGIKAVRHDLKDRHTGTLQYPVSGLVMAKDWNGQANCGGGLHFSIADCAASLRDTLTCKRESEARFQLALTPVDKSLLVDRNKIKTQMALIVTTSSFIEIFESLKLLQFHPGAASSSIVELR